MFGFIEFLKVPISTSKSFLTSITVMSGLFITLFHSSASIYSPLLLSKSKFSFLKVTISFFIFTFNLGKGRNSENENLGFIFFIPSDFKSTMKPSIDFIEPDIVPFIPSEDNKIVALIRFNDK